MCSLFFAKFLVFVTPLYVIIVTKYYLLRYGPKTCTYNFALGSAWTLASPVVKHKAGMGLIVYLLKTCRMKCNHVARERSSHQFLADRTNGRAYATVLRLSVCLSVTLCIVDKRCVLEQKLLLRAYRKSHMRNRLVPK